MTQAITEAAALVELSRAGVEAFSRRRGEPDWLLEARLAAWERFSIDAAVISWTPGRVVTSVCVTCSALREIDKSQQSGASSSRAPTDS